ncbi:hypothetical protein VP01_1598g3 [Puccinia sorghi]|uniref:Uncharacterized protein n=1 Tax=Puccinia sorghi TaxID=27349 RepID=A0A0L6VHG0_9BASI|nr:hypothetical protein VP01_1598g3 [Puccinia sorghi]
MDFATTVRASISSLPERVIHHGRTQTFGKRVQAFQQCSPIECGWSQCYWEHSAHLSVDKRYTNISVDKRYTNISVDKHYTNKPKGSLPLFLHFIGLECKTLYLASHGFLVVKQEPRFSPFPGSSPAMCNCRRKFPLAGLEPKRNQILGACQTLNPTVFESCLSLPFLIVSSCVTMSHDPQGSRGQHNRRNFMNSYSQKFFCIMEKRLAIQIAQSKVFATPTNSISNPQKTKTVPWKLSEQPGDMEPQKTGIRKISGVLNTKKWVKAPIRTNIFLAEHNSLNKNEQHIKIIMHIKLLRITESHYYDNYSQIFFIITYSNKGGWVRNPRN